MIKESEKNDCVERADTFLSKSLTFVAQSAAVLPSQRKRRVFLFFITQNL